MKMFGCHVAISEAATFEPRSFVKLLNAGQELEEVLRRAAAFNRRIEQVSNAPAARYEGAFLLFQRSRRSLGGHRLAERRRPFRTGRHAAVARTGGPEALSQSE